jgi:hypothetical protein
MSAFALIMLGGTVFTALAVAGTVLLHRWLRPDVQRTQDAQRTPAWPGTLRDVPVYAVRVNQPPRKEVES